MDKNFTIERVYFYLLIVFFFTTSYSNLIPSIKSYSFIVFIFMIILFYNIKLSYKELVYSFLFIFFIYSFQIIYILWGQINGTEINDSIRISKYLLSVALLPIFLILLKKYYIYPLMNIFSVLICLKIIIIFCIAIGINIFSYINIEYIYNYTDIKPYSAGLFVRVFDNFSPFFPIALLYIHKKKLFIKYLFHIVLFIYIYYGGSVGLYFSYLVIMLILFRKYWLYIFFIIAIFGMIFFTELYTIIDNIYSTKIYSIDVKSLQVDWIFNNLSFFGNGIGYEFNIEDRHGIVIENIYIYWLGVYGIIGTFIYISIFIIYPILIMVNFINNILVYYIGLTYISILISSISNPYALSGVTLMFPILLISIHIHARISNKVHIIKTNNYIITKKQ